MANNRMRETIISVITNKEKDDYGKTLASDEARKGTRNEPLDLLGWLLFEGEGLGYKLDVSWYESCFNFYQGIFRKSFGKRQFYLVFLLKNEKNKVALNFTL